MTPGPVPVIGRCGRERRRAGFHREHAAAVARFASRRVGAQAAEDVVAETFAIAWRRWPDARRGGLPWLYRTASFCLGTEARGRRRRDRLNGHLAGVVGQEPPDPADLATDRVTVASALLTLGDDDREVLLLNAWEDLGPTDLAIALGCSRTAAAVRLHRARRRLRQVFTAAPDAVWPVPTTPDDDPRSRS